MADDTKTFGIHIATTADPRALNAATVSTGKFGMVVNQVGYQVTDFATQVSMGTSAVQAMAQQLPQAIGAVTQFGDGMKFSANQAVSFGTVFSLLATEVAIGAQLMYSEYQRSMAAFEATNKRIAENAKAVQAAVEWLANEQYLSRLALINRESQDTAIQLERQANALERVNQLRAAQGATAAAQAQAGVTIAQNTGGDVAGAKATALATDVANRIDALESTIATADAKAAQAQAALDAAVAANQEIYNNAARLGNPQENKDFQESQKRVEQLSIARDEAIAALEGQKAIFQETLKQIDANTSAQLSSLQTESGAALTAAAEKTLAAIRAQAEASGGNLSVQARTSMQALEKILADGVVKPDEMARLTDAIVRVRTSREGADKLILDGLNSVERSLSTIFTTLPGLVQRIQSLEGRTAQAGGY